MRMYLSAFLSLALLLAIAGCSQEQFGGSPKSEKNQFQAPSILEQSSCSSYTLIKPKVDILYVVDNSYSTFYLGDDVKNSIKNTISTISQQFDFRVVGTNLISVDNQDYQVFTNSSDPTGLPSDIRRLTSYNDFSFFNSKANGIEKGLGRIHDFMNEHTNGLFRKGAYHLVILISNGQDNEVEVAYGNEQPKVYCVGNTTPQYSCPTGQSVFDVRKQSFNTLKGSAKLNSQQFRIFSVTAPTSCKDGWKPSEKSYRRMSRELYAASLATDSPSQDTFNLCNGDVNTIFASVNSAIKQVVIPHKYNYWPITFAANDKSIYEVVSNLSDIQVYRNNTSAANLIPSSSWTYYENLPASSPLNTSTVNFPSGPVAGDPVTGRHFVKFNSGAEIVHPDCVIIKSRTKTEYFGYVVIAQKPDLTKDVVIRINGVNIPQSSSNGWTYLGGPLTKNIKVAYPSAGDENPAVIKSGFMFQLNGTSNYYKSGDNVEVYYQAAGI